jgi:hypothetical protein
MRTFAALLSTGLAVAAVLSVPRDPGPPDAAWRATHENAVRAAVMRDLLDVAEGVPEHPSMALCASLWTGGGTLSPGDEVDPPPALLAMLEATQRPVYPTSECGMRRMTLVDPTGRPAVKLTVSTLDWRSPRFVKTEGYWLRGGLSAVGYRYTVSLVDSIWRVDTATFEWIS